MGSGKEEETVTLQRFINSICMLALCAAVLSGGAGSDDESQEEVIDTLEKFLESNGADGFFYDVSEKAVCVYEGTVDDPSLKMYGFAVYKEDKNKNITFEGLLRVVKDTGDIYAIPENGEWGSANKAALSDVPEFPEDSGSSMKWKDADIGKETEGIILNKVFYGLYDKGYKDFKIVFNPVIYTFLNMEYYSVSLIEDHETHIIRLEDYLIDTDNGNWYIKGESESFLRTELYYMGNLCSMQLKNR